MALRETLDISEELDRLWRTVAKTYDVTAERPEMPLLLEGADLSSPRDAAVTVLANMLTEAIECLGRFSPWYRTPACDFGLICYHDGHYHLHWTLTPEACRQWADVLVQLEMVIRQNIGVLLASDLVEALMVEDDSCVLACCSCEPQHIIIIEQSSLAGRGVLCHTCQQPYRQFSYADYAGDDHTGN